MRKSVVIFASVGILALVGLLVRHQLGVSKASIDGEPTSIPAAEFSPHAVEVHRRPSTQDSSDITVHQTARQPHAQGYDERLRGADDMWQYAEELLPAATAGDANAQYYLSRALRYCTKEYAFFFIRGDKRRTLDEAMQWASTRPGLKPEDAKAVQERCSRLTEGSHPFGTADEWLSSAKDHGFELAMIDSAVQLAVKAGVSGATENVEMREEAKRLARQALRSKNPEVVFDMGDLAVLFVGDMEKASKEQWVWRLAGCKRGYECGQNAEWYQFHCRFDPNCQPYETGVDSIRRLNAEDFDEIERLANDLNARLDANDFDWFGS